MAAAVNSVAASHHQHQRFPPPLSRRPHYSHQHHLVPTPFSSSCSSPSLKTRKNRAWPPLTSTSITQTLTQRAANNSKTNHLLVVSVAASENSSSSSSSCNDSVDEQLDLPAAAAAVGADLTDKLNKSSTSQVGGFAFEGNGGGSSSSSLIGDMVDTAASSTSTSPPLSLFQGQDFDKMADRAINAAIVLAAGTFAITKLLTIDSDYWQGWTLYEILRYAPLHNWTAYEEALKTNPVLAKMMISGVVYSVGDWIAQCYEGKPLFGFDRARMFRSGLVGFSLHGSLSHYYYYFCEALFPFQDWWVVPVKVLFDQTVWAAIWNSIYYVVLGFLRFESPVTIFGELKATFWPMLTAGWKLWPFAHLITYGVIPVEQRLLWVDCVELVWVTILSTYSNEKSEARHSEVLSDSNTRSLEE